MKSPLLWLSGTILSMKKDAGESELLLQDIETMMMVVLMVVFAWLIVQH